MVKAVKLHEARNELTINSQGVATIVYRGEQSAASIREIRQALENIAPEIRVQHKKMYVIADFNAMVDSDTNAGSRLETRHLLKSKAVDAWAMVGPASLLTLATYLARAARPGLKIRYFSNTAKAFEWFDRLAHAKFRLSNVSLVTGIVVGGIGVLGLLGWILNNPYLMSGIPELRPINPLAALALILTGYNYIAYWQRKARQVTIIGAIGFTLGLLVLLRLPIDQLLFTSQMQAIGLQTEFADTAAVCFMMLSLASFFQGTKQRWQERLQYILCGSVTAIALFNLFGLLYAREFLYAVSPTFVMAFNLSLALFIGSVAFILLIVLKKSDTMLRSVSGIGWLIIIALVFVQVATYLAWSESKNRLEEQSKVAFQSQTVTITDSVKARLKTYVDILHGFRGFFAASDFVTQSDFSTYFESLELEKNYPGFRSMSFISAVKSEDMSAFVQQQQQMNSAFTIRSLSNEPLHFISTYVAGSANTVSVGLDLSSIKGRSAIYGGALAAGESYASGTITFPAVNETPPETGFFITIPVHSARSKEFIGVVNANFNYKDFFPALFAQSNLLKDLQIDIIDPQSGKSIYNAVKQATESDQKRQISVPVENQRWDMHIAAGPLYGVAKDQGNAPLAVLLAGQFFALLLLSIFVMQSRARQQALDLADDVTEDLQVERNQAVARSKKNDAILSGIGDGVFALDMKGVMTLFNPSAERITGYRADEVIGKHYSDVLHFQNEKTHRSYTAFITGALAGKHTSIPRGVVLLHSEGKLVPVADSAAPFYDARRRQQGIIVVFRDATEERAFERTKDEFVSLASHQLRTPLSAINWYVEMLLAGDAGKMNAQQQEYLQEVANGNERMVELINSLLNVSRLDLGKLANHPEAVVVHEVTDSLAVELHGDITKKQLVLKQELNPSITTMQLDPKLFRMVLQNLLSNAVKYTPEKGTVTLTAQFTDKTGHKDLQGAYVLFTVADTGYGIPKVQQTQIFGKMYRAENVQKLGIEGTGLGLYIVKSAVEKMGGRVWFESMESVGTTFYVLLPVRTQKHGV